MMTENSDEDGRKQDAAPMTTAPESLLTYLHRLVDVLAELPPRYRLIPLQLVWLATAGEARAEALGVPGGFEAERARQLAALAGLMGRVSNDEPDLEAERLMQEEDWDGMDRYLEQKFGGGSK